MARTYRVKSMQKRASWKRASKRRSKKRSKKRGKNAFATALQRLTNLRPPQRVQAMKVANDTFVRQFCQKVKSLRRARLPPSLRKRLSHNSKHLRKLVSPKTSVTSKRHMLTQQRGGFLLSILLPIILKKAFGI